MAELLEKIHPNHGGFVVTPNIDHLAKLQKDIDFYRVYQEADYRVCDSQILVFLSRFLGSPIQEKNAGSDLLPAFCQRYSHDDQVRIFLLGGPPGAAQKAQESINKKAGRSIVIDSYCPPFGFEKDSDECESIVRKINQSGANVLAIGVGAPKQEKWMMKYRNHLLHIRTALAIGATIEFEAGTLSRAPRWMSNVGLEWLYRVMKDPKRLWSRYFVDSLPVLKSIVMQKIGFYRHPFCLNGKSSYGEFIHIDNIALGESSIDQSGEIQ